MPKKQEAILGCSEHNPDSVIHRANEVEASLTGSGIYITPVPSLAILSSAITDATNAQTLRGTPGSHGTSENTADYHAKVAILFTIVKQLLNYVNNTTPNNVPQLLSTGFPVSADPSNLPLLDAPLNLHRVITKNVGMDTAKMKWDIPANAGDNQHITYKMFRATSNAFATAIVIGETTKAGYTDVPVMTTTTVFYYWVEAISAAGISIPSAVLVVQIVPLP